MELAQYIGSIANTISKKTSIPLQNLTDNDIRKYFSKVVQGIQHVRRKHDINGVPLSTLVVYFKDGTTIGFQVDSRNPAVKSAFSGCYELFDIHVTPSIYKEIQLNCTEILESK